MRAAAKPKAKARKKSTAKPKRKAKAKTKAKPTKRKVAPISKGYHAVTPYLSVRGSAAAIEFYKKAFGAKEIMRMPGPKGDIGHAEIEIGGSRIMCGYTLDLDARLRGS